MLSACNTVREKALPQISGKAGEVVLVVEDQVWKSTADTILNILSADVDGLNQSEPMFDVVRIPASAFTEIFQRHRNIISCRIAADSAANIKVAQDLWATPQTVVQIVAPSAQAFEQLFSDNRDKISALTFDLREFTRETRRTVIGPDEIGIFIRKHIRENHLEVIEDGQDGIFIPGFSEVLCKDSHGHAQDHYQSKQNSKSFRFHALTSFLNEI